MLMAAVNDLPVVAKALIAGNADVNQARASAKAVPYDPICAATLHATVCYRPTARVKAHSLFLRRTASERLFLAQV